MSFFLSGQRSSPGHDRCVTHLYHIPMWIFDCVIDEVHDLKRACFEPDFGGQGGYLYRIPVWIFDCVLDWLNAGRCDKGF